MKKQLFRLIGVCCAAAVCFTALTASAERIGISAMESSYVLWRQSEIDDGGMLQYLSALGGELPYFISTNVPSDAQEAWVQAYSSDAMLNADEDLTLYLNCQMHGGNAWVLPNTINENEAVQAVLEQYFPPARIRYSTDLRYFSVAAEPEDRAALDTVCRELTNAGLIRGFYFTEQIYIQETLSVPYLTAYSDRPDYRPEPFDVTALEAYIAEQNLPCTLQTVNTKFGEIFYYVIPNEALDFQEHLALAVQLYRELGIVPYTVNESGASSMYPPMSARVLGDITVDGVTDVSDAVLLARFCAEDADVGITEAGLCSADVDGDGLVTLHDVTALLRRIAGY